MPMRNLLKFILSLAVALLLMLLFRSLAFTIYSIDGDGLEPEFLSGDRVMVNRWSYGLRMGGNGLFSYARLCRQPIKRGDIVAYEGFDDEYNSHLLFGRIRALPGDTIHYMGELDILPSRHNCDIDDCYWIESINERNPIDSRQLGFISEQCIIGRICMLVYSHDPSQPFWTGYRKGRFLIYQ